MYNVVKKAILVCLALLILISFSGCGAVGPSGKRIVRISHNQSETHPTHLGLLAFEKHVEDKLGNTYDVQIFPNELLGPQIKTVELTQTGAIDFTVASIAIVESFADIYGVFSIPYLFDGVEHYYRVMEDESITQPIFTSTDVAGFEAVAWYDAGTRNFYTTKKAVNTPDDLKGLKIRVQQSAINVRMMQLFGAAAAPMSFGEVYTALQSNVIDGAENNELALVNNKHGEVAKFYSYNQHQMVPDILIANKKLLDSFSPEDRTVFNEAAKISTNVQRENWTKVVKEAKVTAEKMGVQFFYPDVQPFKDKVMPLHKEVTSKNPRVADIYQKIQEKGNALKGAGQ